MDDYQKREYVRATKEFNFYINTENNHVKALCKDISAGGIRFQTHETSFEDGQIVTIKLRAEEFKKDLTIEAQIINNIGGDYILKYTKINEFDRDKIAGFINRAHTN